MAAVSAGGACGALGACCTVHMGCGHHLLSCPTGRGSTTPALFSPYLLSLSLAHLSLTPVLAGRRVPVERTEERTPSSGPLGVPLPPTKEKLLVSPSAIARSKSRDPGPVSGSKRVSQ